MQQFTLLRSTSVIFAIMAILAFGKAAHPLMRREATAETDNSLVQNNAEDDPDNTTTVDLGNSDCACVGLDVAGEIPVTASVEDEMGNITPKVVTYPASVGSSCKAWDKGLYPGCDVDTPPDWCSAKWCYVDPCNCSIPLLPKRSGQNYTYRGGQAYWSYSTCGHRDTFSAPNAGACVSQNNKDSCNELDGCVWYGEKCFGKEFVEQCTDEPKEEDYGLKTCRCVNREMPGYINITSDGITEEYPASLGANCSAWDDGIWPDCKVDDTPAWCKQKWCYVDPCDCHMDIQPKESTGGAMYKGKPVFWSYHTCGGTDTFTEDPDNLPAFPPEYCGAGDAAAGTSNSEADNASLVEREVKDAMATETTVTTTVTEADNASLVEREVKDSLATETTVTTTVTEADNASLVAMEIKEHVHGQSNWGHDDPCPSVGCNGYKCAWITGEVVSKVVTRRTCSNARSLGNLNGEKKKIETLTQCVREVKRQLLASDEELKTMSNTSQPVLPCSPYFEVHMETYNCACVPHGSDCTELEDRGVCRLQLVEY